METDFATGKTPTPIRTLILEDSAESAVVLLEQLRRAGFEPSYERVDSPQEFAAALERQRWDIVFSDHALGHFNSLDALHMVRERGLSTPFVVVSGSLDDQVEAAVLKGGVNDFLSKGQTTRLPAVVERELQAAKDRAELQRVTRALEQYRSFFELAPIACQILDAAGFLADVNPEWLNWLGYERTDIIGRWWGSLLPAEEAKAFRQRLAELRGGATLPPSEFRLQNKQGGWFAATAWGRTISDAADATGGTCWILSPGADATFDKPGAGPAASSSGRTTRKVLPICMYCKKIREVHGRWCQIETYFEQHTDVHFSHGICPDCIPKAFHDLGAT